MLSTYQYNFLLTIERGNTQHHAFQVFERPVMELLHKGLIKDLCGARNEFFYLELTFAGKVVLAARKHKEELR